MGGAVSTEMLMTKTAYTRRTYMHGKAAVPMAVMTVVALFTNPSAGVAQPGQSRGDYTDVRALPGGPQGRGSPR